MAGTRNVKTHFLKNILWKCNYKWHEFIIVLCSLKFAQMYQAESMGYNSCVSKEIDMLQSKKIREIVFSRNRNGSIIAFGIKNSLKIPKG